MISQAQAQLLPMCALAAAAVVLAWALTGLIVWGMSGDRHLAQPNERSMHETPTSNIGGLAVVAAILALILLWLWPAPRALLIVAGCTGALSLVSWLDHYRPLWPAVRLVAQGLAVAYALTLLPDGARLVPMLPLAAERVLLAIEWLWLINLTNFMDGIDGIAGAEVALVAVGYIAVLLWPFEHLARMPGTVPLAAIMAGACAGYLIWNWHPARIFMGDAGSIPLGFLMGYLMLDLAVRGHWASALILPLVFIADATWTLLARLLRGDKLWRAHKTHFYQRAVQGAATPPMVVGRVTVANLCLIALAIYARSAPISALLAAAAVVLVLLGALSELARTKRQVG